MKIFVGTDHAGFALKEKLAPFLESNGYEVIDKGAYEYNEDDDYPDFIVPVAEEVNKDPENTKGILLGGTGQGEAILANKWPNVRAVVYYGDVMSKVSGKADILEKTREHNDANVLSLGARYLDEEEAMHAVKLWLGISFSEKERYKRRLEKVKILCKP